LLPGTCFFATRNMVKTIQKVGSREYVFALCLVTVNTRNMAIGQDFSSGRQQGINVPLMPCHGKHKEHGQDYSEGR
jgi:FAD synthase